MVTIEIPQPGTLNAPLASITGTAPANARVQVTFDGAPIEVTADATGKWNAPVANQPSPGEHRLQAISGTEQSPIVAFTALASYPNAPGAPRRSSIPWGWIAGLVGVAWLTSYATVKTLVRENPTKTRFRDLPEGSLFEFDHGNISTLRIAKGPWVKMSSSEYRHVDDARRLHKIGSINAAVRVISGRTIARSVIRSPGDER